jgi:polysaccharide deacetylase 2 family uncharacterized protein YibQ
MAKQKIKNKHTKNKKQNRRKSPKTKKLNYKLLNTLLAISIALIIIVIYFLYTYDTYEQKKSKNIPKTTTKVMKDIPKNILKQAPKKYEEYTNEFDKIYIQKEEVSIIDKIKKTIKEDKSLVKEPIKNIKVPKEKENITKEETTKSIIKVEKIKEHKVLATQTNKPKLAIVIDDVTTQYQINKINKIGYKTTLSLMPPTKNHKNSAKIAYDLPFYMIHFPMEATTFRGEEENTLRITDSYETIEKRVSQIRKWYPKAKYTNNHTGSKFTQDYEAMDKLFRALVKYDFTFIDSRTTGKTKGKEMARKYNMPYIARNVFLDNIQEFTYIQNQLKKAIKIAKRKGQAIAICHPHSITLEVLRKSKYLLKDLDLVYLNQLSSLNPKK